LEESLDPHFANEFAFVLAEGYAEPIRSVELCSHNVDEPETGIYSIDGNLFFAFVGSDSEIDAGQSRHEVSVGAFEFKDICEGKIVKSPIGEVDVTDHFVEV
jgi:hypothetical protein